MPNNHQVTWPLEPHTAAKHAILRKYLGGWFPKLGSRRGRVIVLDGFAGPGIYTGGEAGSPLIALRVLLEHRHVSNLGGCEFVFLFNESDPERVKSLVEQEKSLKASLGGEYPSNVRVEVSNGGFESLVDEILALLDSQSSSLAPTFAFIDPFGYKDISMEKLGKLLSAASCELFIYFDFNSVMRFATAGNVDHHFSRLFGCDDYKNAPPAGNPKRATFLRELYEQQLQKVAGFNYVQSFAMVNKSGKTGNYMSFGSRSLDGLDLMKSAMWNVAPTGDYRFSDRLAGQEVLLGLEPDLAPLRQALQSKFEGQAVTIHEIEEFVLTKTPFHRGHIKRKTLAPMQREGLITTNNKRKGSFTAGTVVTFAQKPFS